MIGRKLAMTTACMVLVGAAALAAAGPAPAAQTWAKNKIAFISIRDGGSDLLVMHDDGSHQRNLTPGSSPQEDGPAISPDAERIAFARFGSGDSEIFVIGADGGKVKKLTKNNTKDVAPAWSPNGRKIAYVCQSASNPDNYNLCVLNVKSGHVKHLTHGVQSVTGVTWSPDAKELAFTNYDTGAQGYDVWTVHSDGSHLRNVTKTPDVQKFTPAWSPDGKLLAIGTFDGIRLISPKTGNQIGGSFKGSSPSWSPDGEHLDFYRSDGNDGEIFSAKPDGSHPRNLTDNDVVDYV